MGLFGSGNSGAQEKSDSEKLAEKQYAQQQAEIEQKKKDLYAQRLDIIKSQGGQSFTPQRPTPAKKPNIPYFNQD